MRQNATWQRAFLVKCLFTPLFRGILVVCNCQWSFLVENENVQRYGGAAFGKKPFDIMASCRFGGLSFGYRMSFGERLCGRMSFSKRSNGRMPVDKRQTSGKMPCVLMSFGRRPWRRVAFSSRPCIILRKILQVIVIF